jgi:tetratricopeptide (TPR) repeat protein
MTPEVAMTCSYCRRRVDETARFCPSCGAAQRPDDPSQRLARAYREEVEGHHREAVRAFDALLADPAMAEHLTTLHRHVGNLHLRLGHLRRARYHLEQSCEIDPNSGPSWHDLGIVLYDLADLDGAIEAFETALRRDGEHQLSLFWLGNAYYHRGLLHDAEKAFRSLLAAYPSFTVAHFHLGVVLERMGDHDRALDQFRRVLDQNPGDAAARYYLRHATTGEPADKMS